MDNVDLRAALAEAWDEDRDHVERITLAAAVIATALKTAGMTATLVGGAAIEFHAPSTYVTTDIDFVVEGRTRADIHEVLTLLGFSRQGRHWVWADLFVEVPGNYLSEPTEEFEFGSMTLRVIQKEYVLADRIVGFRHWKYWGYGQQAIALISAFGNDLDEKALRAYLRREGSEDTYDLLLQYKSSGEPVTTEALDRLWHQHYR
jgi:hypothetical protein